MVGWVDVTVPGGAPVTIAARLTGPGPIVRADLRLNDRAAVILHASDLRGAIPLTITWLAGPSGRYRVTLSAEDDRGCHDTTRVPRTLIVP